MPRTAHAWLRMGDESVPLRLSAELGESMGWLLAYLSAQAKQLRLMQSVETLFEIQWKHCWGP